MLERTTIWLVPATLLVALRQKFHVAVVVSVAVVVVVIFAGR